ncbi:MAG TPA: hypothetical protein VFF43_18010 [Caldimonas sp.]|nr:hypothetical protein [Caldimonas sp.]
MSFDPYDLLPALTSLAMIALVVWNGINATRILAAMHDERAPGRDR